MAAINCDVTFFSCLMVSLLVRCFQCEPFQVPSYTIDLDLPPEERWVNVSKKFMKYTPQIAADIRKEIPQEIMFLAELIALHLEKHFPDPYPSEIKGVAKGLNLTVMDVLLLNIMYDMTAYCTSIVAEDKQGNIFHGRNLDYGYSDILRNITFTSNFKSKGKVVYTGVSFAGQVGLLTAQKPNAFTVTLDERDQGSWWENMLVAIFNKKAIPVTFLIRDVVSTEGTTFKEAVQSFSAKPLMADSYLIVGGVKSGEGAVITRNRRSTADVWYLDSTKNRWFLVETNYDHWTTAPPGDDRRDAAIKALNEVTQEKLDAVSLFNVLSVNPVLNNSTVYTTIMEAYSPDLMNTWIRQP